MIDEILKKYGYSNNQISKITESYSLKTMKEETLAEHIEQNFSFLEFLGYKKEQIIKMTVRLPSIYGYSIENIKNKFETLISLGYKKEEILISSFYFNKSKFPLIITGSNPSISSYKIPSGISFHKNIFLPNLNASYISKKVAPPI